MLDAKKILNELSDEDLSNVTGGKLNNEEEKEAFANIRQFATYQCKYNPKIVAWIRKKNDDALTVNAMVGMYDSKLDMYVPHPQLDDYDWNMNRFTMVFDTSHEIDQVKWDT